MLVLISGTANATLPAAVEMPPNYPNPFNAQTTIPYVLPQPAKVELVVYNISGQVVARLDDRELRAQLRSAEAQFEVSEAAFQPRVFSGIQPSGGLTLGNYLGAIKRFVEKPDPKIFDAGCEALGLPADACLYVGDLYPVDYVGARGAGLEAVLLEKWIPRAKRPSWITSVVT